MSCYSVNVDTTHLLRLLPIVDSIQSLAGDWVGPLVKVTKSLIGRKLPLLLDSGGLETETAAERDGFKNELWFVLKMEASFLDVQSLSSSHSNLPAATINLVSYFYVHRTSDHLGSG